MKWLVLSATVIIHLFSLKSLSFSRNLPINSISQQFLFYLTECLHFTMLTSLKGNESLRAYMDRMDYIIFMIENNSDKEKISTFLSELRNDLQNVLIKIQQKRYIKYQTRYTEHVYLPAIKEAQLSIYVRSGVGNQHARWVSQLIQVKMKLEWYLKLGENTYYDDVN